MPSVDSEGQVYYYQVNGELSAWELPEVSELNRYQGKNIFEHFTASMKQSLVPHLLENDVY